MYVQDLFAETRQEALYSLIARNPLGALVATRPEGIEVDHLPFTIHPQVGPNGTVRCHVARGNPLWRSIADNPNALVVFQSPNSYISPSWMPGRKRHGKVAPSWNYAAVHVYGVARVQSEAIWLKEHLHDLSSSQEAHRSEPWSLDEPPPQFVDSLLEYIVGIEITVDRIVGKWFVGQQRSPSDRAGVVAGLNAEGTDAASAVAEMMEAYAPSVTPKGEAQG